MFEEDTFIEPEERGESEETLNENIPGAQSEALPSSIEELEEEILEELMEEEDDEEILEEDEEPEETFPDNDIEEEDNDEFVEHQQFEDTFDTVLDEERDVDNEIGGPRVKRVRMVAKKPPSKWVLFLGEQRKTVQEANPELAMGEVTKFIANLYKELPDSELERLEAICIEKKKEYESIIAHNRAIDDEEGTTFGTNKGSDMPGKGKLLLPLARIKRIIKLDEEVKNVSKESVATIAKATELFIARMALKTATTARIRGGRTINMNDLLHTIHTIRSFEFLDMDFPKPVTTETKSKSSTKRTTNDNKNPDQARTKAKVVNDSAVNGKYSMLNFISGTKRSSEEDHEEDTIPAVLHYVEEVDSTDINVAIEEIDDVPMSRHNIDTPSLPSHLEW